MFPRILFLALVLSSTSLQAVVFGPPRPVSAERIVPAMTRVAEPQMATSGDRALVVWNHGEAATRLDADGNPLDVPALLLPKPQWTSGAAVVAEGSGWTVAWTTFAFEEEPPTLRVVHVSREGVVGTPRDIPLPFAVGQNQRLFLARGEILLAAVPAGLQSVIFAVGESDVEVTATVSGTVRELIATPSGFALLLATSVVRLDDGGSIAEAIALPEGFGATDIAAGADALFVGGNVSDEAAVVRIPNGARRAELLARVTGRVGGEVRLAADGDELVLAWNSPERVPVPSESSPWHDLAAARVTSDGRVTGPVELRDRIGLVSRGLEIYPPDVAFVNGRAVVVWSEANNLFSAGLDDDLRPSAPRLITWRVADQFLLGSAAAEGVVLLVWREPAAGTEPPPTFARRFDRSGLPLDAQPFTLGRMQVLDVRPAGTGFFVRGNIGYAYIGVQGAPLVVETDLELRGLSCTPKLCVAAWFDNTPPIRGVRISRWKDGVLLDAPGVVVAKSIDNYIDLALANDGLDFVAVFARPAAERQGSILEAAHIVRAEGEWRTTPAPFAATGGQVAAVNLLRERDRYLALWSEVADGVYASRLSLDAQSLDGEETSWRGWRVPFAYDVRAFASDGFRTYFAGAADRPELVRLMELREREAVPVADLIVAGRASVACGAPGRCLVATVPTPALYASLFVSPRITLRAFGPGRLRAVRH